MSDPTTDLHTFVAEHTEARKRQFVAGFARFVIGRGEGALAPTLVNGKQETWQAVGRRLYGAQLFSEVLRRELAARKEALSAASGLPPVRGDQGQGTQSGRAAG